MKKLLFICLLLPMMLWSKAPRYLDKSYEFPTIPLDTKAMMAMWTERRTLQEDSFSLTCDDLMAQIEYSRRDFLNADEIAGLIQFRNMSDLMRVAPMSINANSLFEYMAVGTFTLNNLKYLIYEICYFASDYSTILACLSDSAGYPPSLIISGGFECAQLASFKIDTLKNEIEVSRILCSDIFLKQINRYRLDRHFEPIDERYQINLKYNYSDILKKIDNCEFVDIDSIDSWMDYDWTPEAEQQYLERRQFTD